MVWHCCAFCAFYLLFEAFRAFSTEYEFRSTLLYKPIEYGNGRDVDCLMDFSMKVFRSLLCLCAAAGLLSSCSSQKLNVTGVGYQSIRTEFAQEPVPEDAKIEVTYFFDTDGSIVPRVKNLTDQVMTIDQTLSFFINTDGRSTSYYDPTVRTTTTTDYASNTTGASVNLGAVAGAFGVGGIVGGVLSGINVGESNTGGVGEFAHNDDGRPAAGADWASRRAVYVEVVPHKWCWQELWL